MDRANEKVKVVAVVAVRMNSERLPGKVMKELQGRPMVEYLYERVSRCTVIDEIVIATSTAPENDVIEELCLSKKLLCFRGSEEDVIKRLLDALNWRRASVGVVVFGDNPLIDPTIIDQMVSKFRSYPDYDFVGNDLMTTYPPGMEVEVFSVQALAKAEQLVSDKEIRQHGTLCIRNHPEIFRIKNIQAEQNVARSDYYLGVDSDVDFSVVQCVASFFEERRDYPLSEILQFLDANPDVAKLNKHVPRRWRKYRNVGS